MTTNDLGPTATNDPPRSLENEAYILGSMMADDVLLHQARKALKGDDFASERNRLVFEALGDLCDRSAPCDVASVSDELGKRKQLEQVGTDYLAALAQAEAESMQFDFHVRSLREKALRRSTRDIGEHLRRAAEAPVEQILESLDEAESRLWHIADAHLDAPAQSLADRLADTIETITTPGRKSRKGFPSGHALLDQMTGGFYAGELTLVAARPHLGRTAFLLDLLLNFTMNAGKKAVFGCGKDDADIIVERLLAAAAGYDLGKIQQGSVPSEDVPLLRETAARLSKSGIILEESFEIGSPKARARFAHIKLHQDAQCLLLDDVSCTYNGGGAEIARERTPELGSWLRKLAWMFQVPVIASIQLPLEPFASAPRCPTLNDLDERCPLSPFADTVLFLHGVRDRSADEAEGASMQLVIAKQRHGPTGAVPLVFEKGSACFPIRPSQSE